MRPLEQAWRLLKMPVVNTDVPGLQMAYMEGDPRLWTYEHGMLGGADQQVWDAEESHPRGIVGNVPSTQMGQVTQMTPNQYFDALGDEGGDANAEYRWPDKGERHIQDIVQGISEGQVMGMPSIDVSTGGQEGGHRMEALRQMGYGDTPVPVMSYKSEPMDLAMRLLKNIDEVQLCPSCQGVGFGGNNDFSDEPKCMSCGGTGLVGAERFHPEDENSLNPRDWPYVVSEEIGNTMGEEQTGGDGERITFHMDVDKYLDSKPQPIKMKTLYRQGKPTFMYTPFAGVGRKMRNPAAEIFRRGEPIDIAMRLLKANVYGTGVYGIGDSLYVDGELVPNTQTTLTGQTIGERARALPLPILGTRPPKQYTGLNYYVSIPRRLLEGGPLVGRQYQIRRRDTDEVVGDIPMGPVYGTSDVGFTGDWKPQMSRISREHQGQNLYARALMGMLSAGDVGVPIVSTERNAASEGAHRSLMDMYSRAGGNLESLTGYEPASESNDVRYNKIFNDGYGSLRTFDPGGLPVRVINEPRSNRSGMDFAQKDLEDFGFEP